MYRQLRSHIAASSTGDDLKDYINEELIKNGLGITDATAKEIQSLIDKPLLSLYTFANMISWRAQIGWSTHGHSAVDVNIYGTKGSEKLRGNHENTEVGDFLREYLDVDIKAITEELVKKSKTFGVAAEGQASWVGKVPSREDLEMLARHQEEMRIGAS